MFIFAVIRRVFDWLSGNSIRSSDQAAPKALKMQAKGRSPWPAGYNRFGHEGAGDDVANVRDACPFVWSQGLRADAFRPWLISCQVFDPVFRQNMINSVNLEIRMLIIQPIN